MGMNENEQTGGRNASWAAGCCERRDENLSHIEGNWGGQGEEEKSLKKFPGNL